MAMTEIGQATITIIPNMKGSQAKITKDFNAVGGDAGESAGKSFGSRMVGMLGKLGVAAAVGKVFKDSISEGAKLQQSFGGLETLYGDAADYAKEYAYQAAQAGISANDYAEQAVSFGASLKKAFGGDTKKAVEAANTAIMDMTDNAAKMGTPIESIQNAYQGFAKGQYNMLDNLKLGYGGTKTEMERLLADATKLSGVEYNLDNLGDVYDAIHVIQEDLGLTGVAAEEAATTFSGSFGAMKAAASNLLADLSLGNDISASLDALGGSVKTFLVGNLIPMIGNVAQQLPKVIAEIPGFLADMIPELIPAVADLVAGLAEGIITNIPVFLEGLGQLVMSIPQAFMNIDWGGIGSTLLNGLTSAVGGIWDSITSLLSVTFGIEMPSWDDVVKDISDLWDQVVGGIGDFFKAAFEIIADDSQTPIEKISALWDLVADGIDGLWQAVFTVTTDAYEAVAGAISSWWGENVWPEIQNIFEAVFGVKPPDWEDIASTIKTGWDTITDKISEIVTAIFHLDMPALADVLADIDRLWASVWNGIANWFSTTFNIRIPTWEEIKQAVSTFWNNMKAGIAGWFETVFNVHIPTWDEIKASVNTFWKNFEDGIVGWFTTTFHVEIPSWDDIKNSVQTFWNTFKSGISGWFTKMFSVTMPSWEGVKTRISNGWKTITGKVGEIVSSVFEVAMPIISTIVEDIKAFWGDVVKGIGDFLTLKWVLGTPETEEMSKTLGQQIAEERKKYEGGTYEVKGDQVHIDSKAIQDALKDANLSLGDIDTGSLDTALASVTTVVSAIKAEFSNMALALPNIGTQTLGTARALVIGTVAAIKSTMNFYWSLPTLHGHLPVISVNMQTATSSDGKTSVSYPSLSVSSYRWFAEGGVFNRPTVIGIGDSKGPEAAVPLDMMWNRMAKEFDKHLGGGATMTNYITVDGAQRPEEYADRLVRQLKLDLRTA